MGTKLGEKVEEVCEKDLLYDDNDFTRESQGGNPIGKALVILKIWMR